MTSIYNENKAVIRPIAFKPLSGRLSSGGERYGSTPLLASRPGSHMTLYGSSSDVREGRAWCGSPQPASLTALPPATLVAPLHRRHHSAALQTKQSCMSAVSGAGGRLVGGGGGGGGSEPPEPAPAPSPSDSGVSELEAALRDRELSPAQHACCDTELTTFNSGSGSWGRGCSEERAWERELRRLKAAHESRLRAGAQKAMKLEQLLMMQSYQLQQDKQRLQRDAAAMASEMQQLRDETQQLRSRQEDTEWNLCQKTGEIALLKAQLKDAQNEKTTKGHEYLQLKSECRQLRETLERKEKELLKFQMDSEERDKTTSRLQSEGERLRAELSESEMELHRLRERSARETEELRGEVRELRKELSDVSLSGYEGVECGRARRGTHDYRWSPPEDTSPEDAEVQRLNGELPDCCSAASCRAPSAPGATSSSCRSASALDRLRCELDSRETHFDIERSKWAEEKEKVLRYQKQLQLNYVQMFRRSKSLEAEVESLRLELDLCHKNFKNLGKLGTIEL